MDHTGDFIMLETIHGGKKTIVGGYQYMTKKKGLNKSQVSAKTGTNAHYTINVCKLSK